MGENITELYCPYPSHFVIMRNKKAMYIGEVLDIYKKGNNSKYGSLEFATNVSLLSGALGVFAIAIGQCMSLLLILNLPFSPNVGYGH
jgi:hypothetical protein